MKSRRIWLTVAIAICVIALGVMHEPALIFMAHWLDVGETPRAADYVMVLPGGPEHRPFVAVSMLRAGLVKEIFTAKTETAPANDEGLVPASDTVMRRVLMLRGIREDQIRVLPGQSNSTWTDVVALSRFMRENPEATVAIVTDCYHTRRSRWVFHRILQSDARRVFFVSARLDTVSPDSWWKTEEGLTTYLGEYAKLMVYVATDPSVIVLELGLALAALLAWSLWRRKRSLKSRQAGQQDLSD